MSDNAILLTIFDNQQIPDLKSEVFSFDIRIPKRLISESSLIDKIWIAFSKGSNSRLLALITPYAIEDDNDVYIFYGNPSKSEYFSREIDNLPDGDPLVFDDISPQKSFDTLQVRSLSQEELLEFENRLKSSWSRSFEPIPSRISLGIAREISGSETSVIALQENIELSLRRRFATRELKIDNSADRATNPFRRTAEIISHDLITRNIVVLIDNRFSDRVVDTSLVDIPLSSFQPRRWVKAPTEESLSQAFRIGQVKLERAEKRHIEILVDCGERLKSLGFNPMHSNSIDLAFDAFGATYLIEIKSATVDNFFDQLNKGIMQVHWYAWAMRNSSRRIVRCVVIEKPLDIRIDPSELTLFGEDLNVRILLWETEKNWPLRVDGFTQPPAKLID